MGILSGAMPGPERSDTMTSDTRERKLRTRASRSRMGARESDSQPFCDNPCGRRIRPATTVALPAAQTTDIDRTSEPMYTVTVSAEFTATHAVPMPDGSLEAPHAHDWAVRACFAADELDDAEMVVDFLRARDALQQAVATLVGADLNRADALKGRLPTAEVVARYVFDYLAAAGLSETYAVAVREAPGCLAVYQPGSTRSRRAVCWFDDAQADT